jgi:aldose 1-epimerase
MVMPDKLTRMKPLKQITFCRLGIFSLLAIVLGQPLQAQSLKRVEQTEFGKARDGSEVERITLRNARGMSAQIITYGAIIKGLWAPDRHGDFTNILLTADSLEQFQRGFNGAAAITGRVVNRIRGAQFELDGKTYKLTANAGTNTIHGGRKGFAQSVWTVTGTMTNSGESSVTPTYLSKDGEEGFPGNLKTAVIYTLTDGNEFRIDYESGSKDRPFLFQCRGGKK